MDYNNLINKPIKIIWNLLSNGKGTRFGKVQKQDYIISGKTILQHTISNIETNHIKSNLIDYDITIVGNHQSKYKNIPGGDSRMDSVIAAITYHLNQNTNFDLFIIHDGVRPNVSKQMIDDIILNYNNNLHENEFMMIPVDKLVNSIIDINTGTPINRETIVNTHTPEIFTKPAIIKLFNIITKKQIDTNLSTSLFNIGLLNQIPYKLLDNDKQNIKITYKEDLETIFNNNVYNTYSKLLNTNNQPIDTPNKLIDKLIDKQIDKQNILVIGGTSGIGYEFTKLVKKNNYVYACGRKDKLQDQQFFTQLPKKSWDIIVHSAGSLQNLIKKIHLINDDDFEMSYQIHYKSIIKLIKYIVKQQVNHPLKLIILGSSSSLSGTENMSAYSPFKAAITRLSEIINIEYPFISCCAIHPSRTKTKLRKYISSNEPENILLSAKFVALAIYNILTFNHLTKSNIYITKYDEHEYLKNK